MCQTNRFFPIPIEFQLRKLVIYRFKTWNPFSNSSNKWNSFDRQTTHAFTQAINEFLCDFPKMISFFVSSLYPFVILFSGKSMELTWKIDQLNLDCFTTHWTVLVGIEKWDRKKDVRCMNIISTHVVSTYHINRCWCKRCSMAFVCSVYTSSAQGQWW